MLAYDCGMQCTKPLSPRTSWPDPVAPWSAAYWDMRYRSGGHSGAGSSGHLARFKADIVNQIVRRHGIASVIEYRLR